MKKRGNLKKICESIYKLRYVWIICLFLLGVGFEISGSSIGMWDLFIGVEAENPDGNIFGESRAIRTDEWAVNTPMAFSQYFNYSGKFPYFSDTLRGDSTDAYIVYGQPVLSWEVIFRPFQWGYLFMSPGKGLAFFWCGRFLALFMISFELGMYFFSRRKSLAVSYALLMLMSPVIQWWFAINGLVEMLIFGQAAVLIVIAYLREKYYWKKILLMLGLVICGGAYILVFYPSWQIPLGYVFLFLIIGIVIREFKKEYWSAAKDIPIIICFFLILGGSVGSIFYRSWNTIQAVLHTVYPGERIYTGGDALQHLLNWADGILYPYIDAGFGTTNVCEEAGIFSFFPMGILVALWVIIKEKKKDPFLISVLTGTAFLSCYCVFSWPQWLAKITMLSYCQPGRVALGAGTLSLILLIYAIHISETRPGWMISMIATVIISVCIILNLYHKIPEFYQGIKMAAVVFIILAAILVVCFSIGRKRNWLFLVFCAAVSLAGGLCVNPIHAGVEVVYENPLVMAIRETVESDEEHGLWIVENMGFPYNNIPIMVGGPTINSTNTYPDIERWKKLDKDGSAEETYNRYAHIEIHISEAEETVFENTAADQLVVSLPAKDLEVLEVRHILTNQDLSVYNSEKVQFQLKHMIENYRIYDVIYE